MSDYNDEYLRGYNDGLEHGKNARIMLCAENEKLQAALKPFAEIAGWYDVEPDSQPAWDADYQPTVGNLRPAAAALKETDSE